MNMNELFREPAASYSRAAALDDGVLVDVSETGRRVGFRVPLAMTIAAYAECVEWKDADTDRKHVYQTEDERLANVLTAAMLVVRTSVPNARHLGFRVRRIPRAGKGREAEFIRLAMTLGSDDAGERVMTIMLNHED